MESSFVLVLVLDRNLFRVVVVQYSKLFAGCEKSAGERSALLRSGSRSALRISWLLECWSFFSYFFERLTRF